MRSIGSRPTSLSLAAISCSRLGGSMSAEGAFPWSPWFPDASCSLRALTSFSASVARWNTPKPTPGQTRSISNTRVYLSGPPPPSRHNTRAKTILSKANRGNRMDGQGLCQTPPSLDYAKMCTTAEMVNRDAFHVSVNSKNLATNKNDPDEAKRLFGISYCNRSFPCAKYNHTMETKFIFLSPLAIV